MSLLTVIMNPERVKDFSDMMSKLDHWDALIRDNEMKFDKNDISDKMRQAALCAMAREAVVESRLAGRRDLDDYAKIRCMIDDMIRDKRDHLKVREVTSDLADEASEGGRETSSVQQQTQSLSAIVERSTKPRRARAKKRTKRDPGTIKLPWAANGRVPRRD